MDEKIVTTISKVNTVTGEILFKKEYPADTYLSTENVLRDKFLATHSKHEFDSFYTQNSQVANLFKAIPSMDTATKLYFFFCSRTEPRTNKIMHPNGQKITNQFLADYFGTSQQTIKNAKSKLVKGNVIKKCKGWYHLNPYFALKYGKGNHYYADFVLDLFKNCP